MKEDKVRVLVSVSVTSIPKEDAVKFLKEIKGLKKMYFVTGEYDYVILLECENMDELKKTVSEIRKFKGIKSTKTCIILEEITF
ncbi:MAG: Lrp/AsnC ligand binding domain-containing protein [Candidatus Odinarchaeia archaeon]